MKKTVYLILALSLLLCSCSQTTDNDDISKDSSVLDLLLPVLVLIALCIVGLIWTGGMWDAESDNYHNFIIKGR